MAEKGLSRLKRQPGGRKVQPYHLPCCTYFGKLKCLQQCKGFCWPLLALGYWWRCISLGSGTSFFVLELKQSSRAKGVNVLWNTGEFLSVQGGQGLGGRAGWVLGLIGIEILLYSIRRHPLWFYLSTVVKVLHGRQFPLLH